MLCTLDHHPLDLVERNFLGAAVVKLRRARRGMVRHLRGAFERTAVLEVGRDARRAERVVADLRGDAGGSGTPLNHLIGVCLGQGVAGELAGRAAVGLEQERLRVVRKARAGEILMQVGFEIVMAGHGMLLAALLVQAHPEPTVLRVHVLDAHADGRADAGEGIDHKPDQGAVAQTDNDRRINRVDELARLGRIEHRRLASPHDMARAAHGAGGIDRHDLADHHPVEQMPQGGEAQLRGRRGSRLLRLLDIGGDVDALDGREPRHAASA